MSIRKTLKAASFVLALAFPATTLAAAGPASSCPLSEHRVTSVTPYKVAEHVGRGGTIQRLRGAEIFVQAEAGLTAEWLQLELTRHLTQTAKATMAACPFDADDIRIQVDSAGAGFSVKLIARDADGARDVLNRARLLLAG